MAQAGTEGREGRDGADRSIEFNMRERERERERETTGEDELSTGCLESGPNILASFVPRLFECYLAARARVSGCMHLSPVHGSHLFHAAMNSLMAPPSSHLA